MTNEHVCHQSAQTAKPSCHFVIWAPSYNENSGGIIALHALCNRLNELGYSAKIWPVFVNTTPARKNRFVPTYWIRKLHGWLTYNLGPFANKVAHRNDLSDAVVIYPEIAYGNPLGASRVVRWILYHPGRHTGAIDFEENELRIPYAMEFAEGYLRSGETDTLRVTHWNDSYSLRNEGKREGTCFLVHKGIARKLDAHPKNSVCADNLNHSDRAQLFNECKYLYSYDLYSYYNIYAAVCGCIPIIVPIEGIGLIDWYSDESCRYGLAYGIENQEWAISTRKSLISELSSRKHRENETIERFVEQCAKKFNIIFTKK